MTSTIAFNRPYLCGKELDFIREAVESGRISGDGKFTRLCHAFFEEKYLFQKVLMTHSCTAALEMSAILCNIQSGDEVIIPSYTFVSTANAFVLRGAKVIFADSRPDMPHLDETTLEGLISEKTKAIIPVHYAGVACEMDSIMQLAHKYNLFVVEDAAQSINSFFKDKPLGGIGHFGTFSFHETKNIISGEGGLLSINDAQYFMRAEIIREKGTNRSAFFRGEINKYGWVDVGSSYLPSDIISAFLYAQLLEMDRILQKRKVLWDFYYSNLIGLQDKGIFKLPIIPEYSTNNHHIFYLICNSLEDRSNLIETLNSSGINAVFHYLPLHTSEYFHNQHDGRELINATRYGDCLLRLPLHYALSESELEKVVRAIHLWAK